MLTALAVIVDLYVSVLWKVKLPKKKTKTEKNAVSWMGVDILCFSNIWNSILCLRCIPKHYMPSNHITLNSCMSHTWHTRLTSSSFVFWNMSRTLISMLLYCCDVTQHLYEYKNEYKWNVTFKCEIYEHVLYGIIVIFLVPCCVESLRYWCNTSLPCWTTWKRFSRFLSWVLLRSGMLNCNYARLPIVMSKLDKKIVWG